MNGMRTAILSGTRRFSCTSKALQPFQLGKLNHVAIVVPNLDKSTKFYSDILRAKCSEKLKLPEHGVTTVFVELKDWTAKDASPFSKLELLEPLDEKSPIYNFLQKTGSGGIHHICLEVDDIQAAVAHMRQNKVRILGDVDVTKPYATKLGAHGKPVIFLHPKDCGGILVELEQK